MNLFCRNTAFSIFCLLFVASCSSVYQYGPGHLGGESRVLVTPASHDSLRSGFFLGSRLYLNNGDGYNQGESCRFGELSFHHGLSRKFLSFASGVNAFGGSYDVRKFELERGWKRFYGLQASSQIALNIPLGTNFDWRILGLKAGFTLEDGDLYRFRLKYRDYPDFNEYSEGKLIGHAGTYSELMARVREYRFGMSFCNAVLFGREKGLGLASSLGGFLGYRNFTAQYQFTAATQQGSNHSLGLVYRMK